MAAIAADIAQLLDDVRRPGDFCTSGSLEIFAPGLEVEGVGPVALPLLAAQAEQLVAVARRAPYGRGEQTLVDTEVRRTWQIDAGRVRLTGRGWARTLEAIVGRAAEGLGVEGPVAAELYKLLVYDRGSFFIGHRDSEKRDGMFATLVVALPSVGSGGELLVRHKDREARLDLRVTDPAEVAFAAFYADCLHEVLPVVSGFRLTLVYNLSRPAAGRRPTPPDHAAEQNALAARLRRWVENEASEDAAAPDKLVYPLEHAYTLAGLSFATLKGPDAARAATLAAAAETAGCDAYLALLSIEEWGSAEHAGHYGWRRGQVEDEFEPIEVHERSQALTDWRRPDHSDPGLGPLPFDEDELAPPGALDDIAPDEESFREATGNEGATFERSYRRVALVLWPRERSLAVLNQGGLAATLPYLAELAERWTAGGSDRQSSLWTEAHELAGHMLASWPRHPWQTSESRGEVLALLATLCRLGDAARIEAFLGDVSAAGAYAQGDNESIVAALRQLPPRSAEAAVERIVAGNAARVPAACANLLALASTSAMAPRAAAAALLAALRGDPARAPQEASWNRPERRGPEFVVDLLAGLGQIDTALAEAAVDTLLAWPKTYGMDAMLVPAVVALGETAANQTAAGAAVARLGEAAADHLRARIALPLAPPTDWSRDAKLGCDCRHCRELGLFLADPARSIWLFRAAQADRGHVESTVRNSRSDLELKTHRQGRPYTLECTKNQASYQRRVRQREKDQANLALIEVRWTSTRRG